MTRTILLADDSVTIQKVVELTFLDEDFRVVTVGDGAEAISRLASERPELVIADVHMPGADGYQLAEAVGRELPGTPVLLLVGTFEVFDTDRAESAGAAGFLKKPFDSQELLRRAKDLLASGAPAPRATPSEVPAWSPAPAELPELGLPDFAAPAPSFEEQAFAEPAFAEPAFEAEPAALEEVYEPVPAPPPTPLAPPPAAAVAAAPSAAGSNGSLSDADVDRIARRIVELIGDRAVRDVAWEVVPDLAEVLLKARIRELEASVE